MRRGSLVNLKGEGNFWAPPGRTVARQAHAQPFAAQAQRRCTPLPWLATAAAAVAAAAATYAVRRGAPRFGRRRSRVRPLMPAPRAMLRLIACRRRSLMHQRSGMDGLRRRRSGPMHLAPFGRPSEDRRRPRAICPQTRPRRLARALALASTVNVTLCRLPAGAPRRCTARCLRAARTWRSHASWTCCCICWPRRAPLRRAQGAPNLASALWRCLGTRAARSMPRERRHPGEQHGGGCCRMPWPRAHTLHWLCRLPVRPVMSHAHITPGTPTHVTAEVCLGHQSPSTSTCTCHAYHSSSCSVPV